MKLIYLMILIFVFAALNSGCSDYGCDFSTKQKIEIWQDDQRQPDCVSNYNFTNQIQNNIQVIDHSDCLLDIIWLGGGTVESIAVGWNENGLMQEFPATNNTLENLIIERECIHVSLKLTSGQQYAETFHGNNQ